MNYIKILFDALVSHINNLWEAIAVITFITLILAFASYFAIKLVIKLFKTIKITEIKVGNVNIDFDTETDEKKSETHFSDKQTGE